MGHAAAEQRLKGPLVKRGLRNDATAAAVTSPTGPDALVGTVGAWDGVGVDPCGYPLREAPTATMACVVRDGAGAISTATTGIVSAGIVECTPPPDADDASASALMLGADLARGTLRRTFVLDAGGLAIGGAVMPVDASCPHDPAQYAVGISVISIIGHISIAEVLAIDDIGSADCLSAQASSGAEDA